MKIPRALFKTVESVVIKCVLCHSSVVVAYQTAASSLQFFKKFPFLSYADIVILVSFVSLVSTCVLLKAESFILQFHFVFGFHIDAFVSVPVVVILVYWFKLEIELEFNSLSSQTSPQIISVLLFVVLVYVSSIFFSFLSYSLFLCLRLKSTVLSATAVQEQAVSVYRCLVSHFYSPSLRLLWGLVLTLLSGGVEINNTRLPRSTHLFTKFYLVFFCNSILKFFPSRNFWWSIMSFRFLQLSTIRCTFGIYNNFSTPLILNFTFFNSWS